MNATPVLDIAPLLGSQFPSTVLSVRNGFSLAAPLDFHSHYGTITILIKITVLFLALGLLNGFPPCHVCPQVAFGRLTMLPWKPSSQEGRPTLNVVRVRPLVWRLRNYDKERGCHLLLLASQLPCLLCCNGLEPLRLSPRKPFLFLMCSCWVFCLSTSD